jgi:molybdopterin molybdotransferase
MLSVAEAQQIVLEHARPLPRREGGLPIAAVRGCVLAEDVVSDLDMPPFDKAMMDGFAVRAADVRDGNADLLIIEEVTAGQTPKRTLAAGQATRIMTGAPVPAGADSVVMIERCAVYGDRVRLSDPKFTPGQNILPRGQEMRTGEVVLRAGTVLRPQEIGLLAAVGRTFVPIRRPRLYVLATGDELVRLSDRPGPGQIRNSNAEMLKAQGERAGAETYDRGIARDNVEDLTRKIEPSLAMGDVVVLSGGVSAGKLDLVPGVLEELGVRAQFHKVAMKPGKPVLFGVKEMGDRPAKLVFGLPGNPVASFVCFELFVRPAIRALMGLEPGPRILPANLAEDFAYRSDRPTYHPAKLELSPHGWAVRPVPWFGSPDLRGIAAANAFVVLPEGDHLHRAGQTFPVLCGEEV